MAAGWYVGKSQNKLYLFMVMKEVLSGERLMCFYQNVTDNLRKHANGWIFSKNEKRNRIHSFTLG